MCHELLLSTATVPEEGLTTEVEGADADVPLVMGADDVNAARGKG